MIEVGLTGGIGAGKTTVASIFSQLGIPVYQSDSRAKNLVDTQAYIKTKINALFGEEMYTKGKLNRAKVAQLVFRNKSKLASLNAIIHPEVAKDYKQWVLQQQTEYVIKEAAILIETGGHKNADALVVVSAPEQLRIERVMKRNSMLEKEVEARIKNQMPQENKDALADFLIVNNEQDSLIHQVLTIHHQLLSLSKKQKA